jgi:hypothetical protein
MNTIEDDNRFEKINYILEFFEEQHQKLIREDKNILTFVGDVEFLNKLNVLPSSFQRQIHYQQVNEIVDYQKKVYEEKKHFEIFNCIYICYSNTQPNYQIIDGQHRYCAFQKLLEIYGNFKIEYKIIVCENVDQMHHYFKIINLSRPLILHDKRNEAETMRILIGHIRNKYKPYIKQSENPRVPNINLDKLERMLKEYKVITKCLEKNLNIVDLFENINTFYQTTTEKYSEKWHQWGVTQYQIELSSPKLFLGLYKNYEWVSHLIRHIDENIPFESFEHRSSTSNERITKKLRRELWKKFFGESRQGICYCCEDMVDEDNYHAGHIIARVKGGETNIHNLRPICPTCNRDMLIENMDDYKSKLEKQIH